MPISQAHGKAQIDKWQFRPARHKVKSSLKNKGGRKEQTKKQKNVSLLEKGKSENFVCIYYSYST
jgi:hypothetical protein